MNDLFSTGVRPAVDAFLLEKAAERRDYGEYWPASSAGFCMRRVVFDRLQVPYVKEDARKQRVFEVGHIFHEWMQRITKETKLSIAQETELRDEKLMVRGHIDDLILVGEVVEYQGHADNMDVNFEDNRHLVLYDYKTQNSRAFSYQKDRPVSHFHKMQIGTYMLKLRKIAAGDKSVIALDMDDDGKYTVDITKNIRAVIQIGLTDSRILKISKDDLRMSEQQLLWSPDLEKEIVGYWSTLNGYWKAKALPSCTCATHEGGFFAKPDYNPYYYKDQPCSIEWAAQGVDLTGWKF